MFFGMCNSPATFQSMMDEIFADMMDEGIVIIYMDDVFIFAPDEITLTENTKRVLARLQENDLFLKPTKCEFNKTKFEYLGMVIEEGKISMDPGKLKGIQDWCKVGIRRGRNGATEYSRRWENAGKRKCGRRGKAEMRKEWKCGKHGKAEKRNVIG